MKINSYIAALILTFGLTAPALAECPAGQVPIDQVIEEVTKAGATNSILNEGMMKALEDKKGKPPSLSSPDTPYSVVRIDKGGFSALQPVENGCALGEHIGPVPSQMIDNLLGTVNG